MENLENLYSKIKTMFLKFTALSDVATFPFNTLPILLIITIHTVDPSSFEVAISQRVISKNTNRDVVFSPASIQSLVVMAALGAAGETEKELRSVLEVGDTPRERLLAIEKELDKHKPEMQMANKVYVDSNTEVCKEFAALEYQSENVNFSLSIDAAIEINNWIEEETAHKITKLFTPKELYTNTSAILINTVYLKGEWLKPFDVSLTKKSGFYKSEDEAIIVDMMSSTDWIKYSNLPELDAAAVELPFIDSRFSMLILLPNLVEGLESLESKLTANYFADIVKEMRVKYVLLQIPKFKIEVDLDLKSTLEEMGAKSMFGETADFSHFVCNGLVKVDEIRHKAFIELTEEGTEAAAFISMNLALSSARTKRVPIKFKADHPFVFMILDYERIHIFGHVVFE